MSAKKISSKQAAKRPAAKTPAKAPAKKSAAVKTPPAKKAAPAKATKKSVPAKPVPAKKAETRPAKTVPAKQEARPLIAPAKRGRKPKAEAARGASTAAISVPRDVRAASKRVSPNRARAYTPAELEQLLFQRGTAGINVFSPELGVVPAKKAENKKIILKELPKSDGKRTVGAVSISDLFGFNPFAKDAVSQEEALIPEKWRKYYRKLMARKDELMANISRHSENAFRKEGKEETGDVSAYSQHTADIDNEAFDRDFAISRLAAEQEELSEINIAVERMKKGTYGICEITGKPIPAERLNKVPFTRYSVEGKIEAEKQRRVEARRRRANATGDISEVIDIENDSPISLPEEHEEP
ncbi:TraR/DksA family transcriptional regulator [Candidatus Spyradosoma sp. SGI.093]|uniref:TraR/DksA family transcriptional regulator n=1 Tax=Candidatus Spyradosoma sp. SGI.093 TaxID=3420583 RepID=UPI003CFDD353